MSLRARLLAAFAYALLVVIVALMVPLATNLDDRVNAEVEADSAAQAQMVAASVADQLGRPVACSRSAPRPPSSWAGGSSSSTAAGGCSPTPRARAGSGHRSSPTRSTRPCCEALDGGIGQGTHPPGLDVLSTAVPIVRNGRTIGALEVEQSLASVNDEVRDDVAALIGIGVLALALGLGVAWILAGSISRPLHALADAARRMAGGDLAARAPEPGLERAGRGGAFLQRDGGPARRVAGVPARLRRRRLPPAPHPTDRTAAAAGGRRREGRRSGGPPRRPRPSARPSGSRRSSVTCSRSPRARRTPSRDGPSSGPPRGPPPAAGGIPPTRAAASCSSTATASSR